MTSSVNKCILIGNVCANPESRSFSNGGKVCNFTLATSERWKDKQTGERKEKSEFHRVAIFNEGLVGIVERYVKKGSKIYIEGALQTRKWQNKDGQDQYTTEVVLQGFNGNLTLLDSKSDSGRVETYTEGGLRNPARNEGPKQDFDLDDDIPF